mgnify:FL=1|jgi:RNA polymerase sigma factor (sigma-70 family)
MEPRDQAASRPDVERARPDVEALYLQHKDAMWGMALSMLRGDTNQAKDVIQEVVLALAAKRPRDVDNWEAYLVTAVKLKIRDLWKSARHRRERLRLEEITPIEGERLGADDLGLDPAVLVEEDHERSTTVTEVREALAELRVTHPDAHYVFVQVKAEGRTSQDVSAELGVSDSRVRQHVMTARSELRKILEARGGER